MREGPKNPDAGLAGAYTFQDKHVEQYHALGKLKTIVLFGLHATKAGIKLLLIIYL